MEIVGAKDILFGLTATGVCAAFDRDLGRRICFLNIAPDEVIRSLFYNKTNDSLITVSVYRHDNFSSLKCRSTPIAYVARVGCCSAVVAFSNVLVEGGWVGMALYSCVCQCVSATTRARVCIGCALRGAISHPLPRR